MALKPARRAELETTLTRIVRTLADRPDNEPLVAFLRSRNMHITDVQVTIQSGYNRELESREMAEWERLFIATRSYRWDDFTAACSRKIDITGAWKTRIADVIGEPLSHLQYAEQLGWAKWEWLPKVADLPDWTPEPRQRSNFAQVAGKLVRRLRHAGMSNHEIAQAFTDFLRDFNGTHVSAADVRQSNLE